MEQRLGAISRWIFGAALLAFGAWSFVLAVGLPLDTWDGYDYLVNARLIAGHDLARLSQLYRPDRPPGISLLVAPLLRFYEPGQRGGAGWVHLVPWSLGLVALVTFWRSVRTMEGPTIAFFATVLFAMHPLMVHSLPFVMADVPSMTFALLSLGFAERAVTTRTGSDFVALACCVALALLSKYPVAALGLAVPLANAGWTFVGKGRPASRSGKLISLVQPRLAVPLVVGLLLFLVVEAVLFDRFGAGTGSWHEKLIAGLRGAWGAAGGGATGGETDPRWELPSALLTLSGVPVALLVGLGAVRTLVTRELRALLHLVWVVLFLGLFVALIAHKETRYAFPVVPSCFWLAAYGLGWIRDLRVGWIGAAVAGVLAFLGALGPSVAEFERMSDPLYRRPSLLGWARRALELAGADRPIFQLPVLPQFALYPKQPVVLATDEFWHYHHFNEGGLVWFFDRRLQALQVQAGAVLAVRHESPWYYVTVPAASLAVAGDDAVWLEGFPTGAVVLSTAQGWYETRTAAQQPEPPAPFVLTDVVHVRLEARQQGERATFEGSGAPSASAVHTEQGWSLTLPEGFRWFGRSSTGALVPLVGPVSELPIAVEGLAKRVEQFPVR